MIVMAKEYTRNRRVADLIQRELAKLIQRYIQDDEIGLVTISSVDVSPDLKNARIFFTCLSNKVSVDDVTDRLNEFNSQFRHELSQILIMRSVPRIHFEFDQNLDRANRLTALIESLHPGDNRNHD